MTLFKYTSQIRNASGRLCVDCHHWMHCADAADNATVNTRWTLGRQGLQKKTVTRHTDCANGLRQLVA